MVNLKISTKNVAYIYMLSIFSYGFIDVSSGIQFYRVLTLFLFFIACFYIVDKQKIIVLPKFYILLFFTLIILSILKYNNFGYHQLTAYFNVFILIYVSVFCFIYSGRKEIFNIYISFCSFYSIIGILQEVFFILGFNLDFFKSFIKVTNITMSGPFVRVFSLTSEPSHLAILLMPCVLIIFANFLTKEKIIDIPQSKKIVILICYILTFSTLAYSYILLYISILSIIKFKNKKVYGMVFLSIPFFIMISQVEAVYERLNSIQYIISVDDSVNSSVFAIQSNLQVARNVISNNFFFGNGPFTHDDTYLKVIGNIYHITNDFRFLNVRDGSSLYIRIISEFGFFGITAFVSVVIIYIKKNINNYFILSFVIALLCYGLRNGNYDNPLLWFIISFFIIYTNGRKHAI